MAFWYRSLVINLYPRRVDLNNKSHLIFFCSSLQNVDRFYSVVGVLEELDLSLRVMEEFLPRYFAGASEVMERADFRHANRYS